MPKININKKKQQITIPYELNRPIQFENLLGDLQISQFDSVHKKS